jgi:predicted ribosome quality control (RQC) complex YloA/Tae2 family protein
MRLPDDLVPAKVQKVSASADDVVVEVFAGTKRFVAIGPGRVAVVAEKPALGGEIDQTFQGLLRKELVPGIITAVQEADDERDNDVVSLTVARQAGPPRQLIIEREPPMLFVVAVTDEGRRILATVPRGKPADGRDTRRGRLYEPPAAPRRRVTAASATATAATTTTTTTPAPAMSTVPPELQSLRQRLKAEADRLKRLQKRLAGDLTKHGDATALALHGELLKGHMGQLHRGMETIDVVGTDGETLTLKLDPRLDAKGNLERFFKAARKARAAREHAGPKIDETDARLALVNAARAAVAGADVDIGGDVFARARALVDDARAGPSPRRRAATTGTRQAWRVFVVAGGVAVRVGRGAKDNDALVKSARGNDLWMHARDRSGAHVVIPSSGAVVPDDVVLDAAHLAAWFSGARGESHVDIQQTRVKHLRKPGSGAPGLFLVAKETVMHLRVDADRVQRLLATEQSIDGP